MGFFLFLFGRRDKRNKEKAPVKRLDPEELKRRQRLRELLKKGLRYYVAGYVEMYHRYPRLQDLPFTEWELDGYEDLVDFIDLEKGDNITKQDLAKLIKRELIPYRTTTTRYLDITYRVYLIRNQEIIKPVIILDKEYKNIIIKP